MWNLFAQVRQGVILLAIKIMRERLRFWRLDFKCAVIGSIFPFFAVILLSGCDHPGKEKVQPTLVWACSEEGVLQYDYFGPGMMHYSHDSKTISLVMKSLTGTTWVKADGEMHVDDTNHAVFTIRSQSDRSFDVQLLGVATNYNLDLPEDRARETLHIAAGVQTNTFGRFIIYTYDFHNERHAH